MEKTTLTYRMGRVIAFMLISSGCTHNEIKKMLSIAEQQVDAVPYGCDDLLAATGLSSDTIMDVATKMIKDSMKKKEEKNVKKPDNKGNSITMDLRGNSPIILDSRFQSRPL